MKVVTLVENTSCHGALRPEHGLSLYLETNGYKILFDMGQTDAFARNAAILGIDLSAVDLAILSHGHYDHGGGLDAFLKINQKAPVYIHEAAFGNYYNGTEKYIGLDQAMGHHSRLIFTKDNCCLSPNLLLTDCNGKGWTFDSWGLNRREDNGFLPDSFLHEQYLLITEGKKRILISGCSHKGIVNIAGHFQPDVLIGGFHLNKQKDRTALLDTSRQLLKGNTVYYTGHCTGSAQYTVLKEAMGDRLQSLSTGSIIQI